MPDVEPQETTMAPGDVIAGKYRVERLLGRGGMGTVVSATHLKLGERVAIKFLHGAAAADPEAVKRFEREARAAVRIKSEHVARVLDIGLFDDGTSYIVMEHLEGGDLGREIKRRGPLPIAEAVGHILQACEALAEAHAIGIVHRDLKPGNLFLAHRADGSPCIKVLDFGISKLGGSDAAGGEATLTTVNSILGSPTYMAPEQISDPKGTDARADIWSLGATLYRMLSGKPPFAGDSMMAICGLILSGKPPPALASLRPDVPPGLEAVVHRCLSADRGDRFANVGDLAGALAEFGPPGAQLSAGRAQRVLGSAGIIASQPVPIPVADVLTPLSALTQPKTQSSWTRAAENPRSAAMIALIVAVILVGVGVSVGVVVNRPGPVTPATLADGPPAPVSAPPALPPPTVVPVATAAVTVAPPTVSAGPTASARPSPPADAPQTARPASKGGRGGAKKSPGDLFEDR